jgi:hypothetical protein
MAYSNPAYGSIMSANNPYAGFAAGPTNLGTFGLSGPNVPSSTWDPSGAGSGRDQTGAMARFLNYGLPKGTKNGRISLGAFEFVSQQYCCPHMNDEADLLLMPEQPAFFVNEKITPEWDGSVLVLSVAKLNKLFNEQWQDFVRVTSDRGRNPYYDDDAAEFKDWMERYGEAGLDAYGYAYSHENTYLLKMYDAKAPDLRRFHERATQDGYCYLTRYGILRRISYAGIILATNRGVGLDERDQVAASEHSVTLTMALGKRTRVAQLFGTKDDITTGSRTWITLTRKPCYPADGNTPGYGTFVLRPGGHKVHDYPLASEKAYRDESGTICTGHHWMVGVVIEPAERDPQPSAIEQACNTGVQVSEKLSYEMHATLPSMYVALGFK